MTRPHTGGCQCGAVRYRVDGDLANVSICYCRMCQKSSGQLVGIYGATPVSAITWTRGTAKIFRSSAVVERGFCADCGTNLTFRYMDKAHISLAIGSLDEPMRVALTAQYGIEGKMPWFDDLASVPGSPTDAAVPAERLQQFASFQHPDHDTDAWPPQGDAT